MKESRHIASLSFCTCSSNTNMKEKKIELVDFFVISVIPATYNMHDKIFKTPFFTRELLKLKIPKTTYINRIYVVPFILFSDSFTKFVHTFVHTFYIKLHHFTITFLFFYFSKSCQKPREYGIPRGFRSHFYRARKNSINSCLYCSI